MQVDFRERSKIAGVGTLGTPVKQGVVDLTPAALKKWRQNVKGGRREVVDAVRAAGRAAGLDEIIVNLPFKQRLPGSAYAAIVRMDEDGDAEHLV